MNEGGKKILEAGKSIPDMPVEKSFADVIEEMEKVVKKYVELPDSRLATLIALWIANSYFFDRFMYCGYLSLHSASPRCGKTKLLRILSLLANGNPPITAIPTASTLFRSDRTTLILDEVDKLKNSDTEIYGTVLAVLNVGFESGACIERMKRGNGGFVTEQFSVYGPKALAGLEGLADALSDRSFKIEMKRASARTPRLNIRRLAGDGKRIREVLANFAERYGDAAAKMYDDLPDEVEALKNFDDRLQDISEPLLVLSSVADSTRGKGEDIAGRLLFALKLAAGYREDGEREGAIRAFLGIVEEVLEGKEEAFVGSQALVDLCGQHEGLSYIETPRQLAALLKNIGLKPGPDVTGKVRGYRLPTKWFEEWSNRYPPEKASNASNVSSDSASH